MDCTGAARVGVSMIRSLFIGSLFFFLRPLFLLWLEPVHLSGVAVGVDGAAINEDAQLSALQRALINRIQACRLIDTSLLPSLSIVKDEELQFHAGKSVMKQRINQTKDTSSTLEGDEPEKKRNRRSDTSAKPCGNSINWLTNYDYCTPCAVTTASEAAVNTGKVKKCRTVPCQGGSVEVTIAHTGALQGAIKSVVQSRESASRLSRAETLKLFVDTAVSAVQSEDRDVREVVTSLIARCTGDSNSNIDTAAAAGELLNVIPYYRFKERCSEQYSQRRAAFLASEAFAKWLVDDPKADSGSMTNNK